MVSSSKVRILAIEINGLMGGIEEVGFRGFNDELDVGGGVRFIK